MRLMVRVTLLLSGIFAGGIAGSTMFLQHTQAVPAAIGFIDYTCHVKDANGRCITGSHDLFRVNPDGSHYRRLTLNPDFESYVTFSPDGRSAIFARQSQAHPSGLFLVNSMTLAREQHLTPDECYYDMPQYSPDGTQIAALRYCDAMEPHIAVLVPGETVQPVLIPSVDGIKIRSTTAPQWSPDGAWFAILGDMQSTADADLWYPTIIRMRPDGSDAMILYRATDDGNYPGENGIAWHEQAYVYVGMPAWSADGSYLVFSRQIVYSHETHKTIVAIDADGSHQRVLLDVSDGLPLAPHFYDMAGRLIVPERMVGTMYEPVNLTMSVDGRYLYFSLDSSIHVYDLQRELVVRVLYGGYFRMNSALNQLVLRTWDDNEVRVYDVESGQTQRVGHEFAVHNNVAWIPSMSHAARLPVSAVVGLVAVGGCILTRRRHASG